MQISSQSEWNRADCQNFRHLDFSDKLHHIFLACNTSWLRVKFCCFFFLIRCSPIARWAQSKKGKRKLRNCFFLNLKIADCYPWFLEFYKCTNILKAAVSDRSTSKQKFIWGIYWKNKYICKWTVSLEKRK